MFIKENLNPKARKTGDCVIRAIAKAEGKSWLYVFDALTIIARNKYSIVNHKHTYEAYLDCYKIVPCKIETAMGNVKYTVKEFADTHPMGTYLISIAGHMTVVIDGNIYDTWDCSNKKAYKIWEVK